MAQTGGVVRFCTEGDCILSSPRSTRESEKRTWHPVLNPDSVYLAQRSLTPNLNSGRIQLLRKSLTPEARRAHLGMYNSTGSLIRHSGEIGLKSGRSTAPCTPLRSKPHHPLNSPGKRSPLVQQPAAGQSSVVTFTFVEKSSVKTVNCTQANAENKYSSRHQNKKAISLDSGSDEVNCHKIADVQQGAISPSFQAASPVGSRTQLQPGSPVVSQRTLECGSGRASPCITDDQSFNTTEIHDSLHRRASRELLSADAALDGICHSVDQRPSESPVPGREMPVTLDNITSNSLPPMTYISGVSAEDTPSSQRSPMRTESPCEVDSWEHSKETSAHAQRVAKAKWEFFYGSPEPQRAGIVQVQQSPGSPTEASPQKANSLPGWQQQQTESEQVVARHSLCHVEVEIDTSPLADPVPGSCETGIIRRTVKYSETDLDSVPLRCYRETNIDDILAEKEDVDSAIGSQKDSESNKSFTGTLGRRNSELEEPCPPTEHDSALRDRQLQNGQEDEEEEDEVFEVSRQDPTTRADARAALKSPVPVLLGLHLSEDGTDSFSKHFENIMESHRAKGTSYTSLDSIDALSSPGLNQSSFFSFDLPTLTPEIQDQIRHNVRLIEENFAPLAHLEPDSGTSSTTDPACNEREEDEQPGVSGGTLKDQPRSPCRSEDSFIMMQSVVLKNTALNIQYANILSVQPNGELDHTDNLWDTSVDETV